jgi:hypothetical protein
MTNNSSNRPVSLRDLEQLLNAVSTGSFYVKPDEYRRITGLGRTQFYYLKKSGRFDAGIHPATLGRKRILIHKFFNIRSQKIEWFGIEKVIPNKRGRKIGTCKKTTPQQQT